MMEFVDEELQSLKDRIAAKQRYQYIFQLPQGRKVLHDIVRRAGIYSVAGPVDPVKLAYAEGRRSLCLEILSMLRMDNETAMLKLLEERDNRGEQS